MCEEVYVFVVCVVECVMVCVFTGVYMGCVWFVGGVRCMYGVCMGIFFSLVWCVCMMCAW